MFVYYPNRPEDDFVKVIPTLSPSKYTLPPWDTTDMSSSSLASTLAKPSSSLSPLSPNNPANAAIGAAARANNDKADNAGIAAIPAIAIIPNPAAIDINPAPTISNCGAIDANPVNLPIIDSIGELPNTLNANATGSNEAPNKAIAPAPAAIKGNKNPKPAAANPNSVKAPANANI